MTSICGKGKVTGQYFYGLWKARNFMIYLIDCVFSIFKLGNIEALLLLDVLADNLGDLDDLGDAGLDGFGGGNLNRDDKWNIDQWNTVLLSLKNKFKVIFIS
jgi:hypothetical protein